jgi:hypothetical protein
MLTLSALFLLGKRYKTSTAGKNLERILQNAIQRGMSSKQSSSSSSPVHTMKMLGHNSSTYYHESLSSISLFNSNQNESRILSTSSSSNVVSSQNKHMHRSATFEQPLNLSVTSASALAEDDSGTASSSPTNSLFNHVPTSSSFNKSLTSSIDKVQQLSSSSNINPIWDESITNILLTVAKQRDTRVVKINVLRSYLEDKLGVVEFLCLYRGFKSEPKLTFHGTPWEHYQRFLPVLFTLLALDNTNI